MLKTGYGGFEQDDARVKYYYTKAWQSRDTDIFFKGKIADKLLALERSKVKQAMESLSK